MRGDRPIKGITVQIGAEFTPHARGSTCAHRPGVCSDGVYPACAGIDLLTHLYQHAQLSLPRMRGDRPWPPGADEAGRKFTPHARGSTLFGGVFAFGG